MNDFLLGVRHLVEAATAGFSGHPGQQYVESALAAAPFIEEQLSLGAGTDQLASQVMRKYGVGPETAYSWVINGITFAQSGDAASATPQIIL
jgi:hypothetical protein